MPAVAPRPPSPRVQLGTITLITLIGAALRFYHLGDWSMWIDEIYTIERAQAHVNLSTILNQWWHPSLSVILTGINLQLFGVNEFVARLAPALIGILTVPILFLVVRRWFGPEVALLAAAMLAVSTWHIEASQTARYFTSMVLLYLLALVAFQEAAEGASWRYVVLFYVLLVLCLGERFVAASLGPVVVVSIAALAVLRVPLAENRNGMRNVAIMLIPGIVAVLADGLRWLVAGESFFLSWAALTYDRPVSNPLSMMVMIVRAIGVPVVALGAFTGVWLVLERSRRGLLVLAHATVPLVLVLLLNPLVFTKDRFAFAALPAWIILAAIGVWHIASRTTGRHRLLAFGMAAALLADAMSANAAYYRVNNGNRLDWRRAFETVNERAAAGDEIVTWWPEFGRYYTPMHITRWADIDSTTVMDAKRAHWFVLDSETINGNFPMRQWVEREAELIAVYYLPNGRNDYLRIYRFPRSSGRTSTE